MTRYGGRGKTAIDKHERITITLHPEILYKLELYKISTGLHRSTIIQNALIDYLPDVRRIIDTKE